jgi:glycosyltransferase involved in cell wall biosynthesis
MIRRLALVVSHPIQHFVSFYRELASDPELEIRVLFGSRMGLEPYFDKELNTIVSWRMDLLSGYDHIFLSDIAKTGDKSALFIELSRFSPDAVLIYGYSQTLSRHALRWCLKQKVPAIMISDSELKSVRSFPKAVIKRIIMPKLLERFTAFLTVGDNNEDYYRHYGVANERLFRSPFTIDEQTYRDARVHRATLRESIRNELGIDAGAVVALTVGKLSSRKRPGDVIEAARLLAGHSHATPIHFVLAGDGEEFNQLKRAAEGLPVTLAGFVNVDRLPSFYAAADLIVHPSSQDPHPLVMSEAACIGLPLVISSRVGAAGPTDIAQPERNAIVFPMGDVNALSNAIAQLAVDRPKLNRMAQASLEIFEELDIRCSVAGAKSAIEFACK